MRKKVDARIRTLVENNVKTGHRSMFVIVGDKGRDQVVNLHYMLSKTVVKARPTVLWCYKKELKWSSHVKKRRRQIKREMMKGLLDPDKEDPFSLFMAATSIRFCYYHETHRILGNTYGMCVLQDFEALTPNLLARTIETVEGGGIVVLLLSTLSSLTQLYSLSMDVHARLRTASHQDIVGRFNERLVLSLASNRACILMDDELNILPTSSHVQSIAPLPAPPEGGNSHTAELKELVASLTDTQPAGALVACAKTLDQARALVAFLDVASERTLRATVALTASRGRGKSAALGLALAGALGLGYSNIFVTAPSPENLRTLFEFVFKGLDALGYAEHIDYDLVESTNPAFAKAIVRVNVFRNHRQTVQYIQPQDHARLAAAELVVIDEAAAIPLPLVKAMLGPYLVLLCSTVNGYEGTGRSLSLKLLQQLRAEGAKVGASGGSGALAGSRTFRDIQMEEPIRYAAGDAVEAWLHGLLCLDAATHLAPPPPRLPHPSECDLYYVQRDTLFSFHKASEAFLQRMVALFVASHYRNTPNDLLLMADAPAHHMFALLGPVDPSLNALPDILAVIQVALEGTIAQRAARNALSRGDSPQGDLIPWTVGQQFQDADFPALSGARVVRIAVHPDLPRSGYGSRALALLRAYYQGELADLAEEDSEPEPDGDVQVAGDEPCASRPDGPADNGIAGPSGRGLLEERVAPRAGLPPLLVALGERPPEALQWLGASFGLTQPLLSFWHRAGYRPVYLRQSPSDVTGEHTVIVLSALQSADVEGTRWLEPFAEDFRCRLAALLAGAFREFSPALALALLDPKLAWTEAEAAESVVRGVDIIKSNGAPLTPYDMKRLQAYANSLVDHHLVLDLVPALAGAYFSRRLPVPLMHTQAAILAALGLQRQDVSALETTLGLPAAQVLALFNKAMRKLHGHLRAAKVAAMERTLPVPRSAPQLQPHAGDLDAELDEAAAAAQAKLREAITEEDLRRYAVEGSEADFAAAVGGLGVAPTPKTVSVQKKGGKAPAADRGGAGLPGNDVSMYKKSGKKQKRDLNQRPAKKSRT